MRASGAVLRFSPPRNAPPATSPGRAAAHLPKKVTVFETSKSRRPRAKGQGASGSAPLVRREAQDWRPRAQREPSTDSSRLSERSECNERSELRDAGRQTEHRRAVGAAHRPHQ